VRFRGVVQFNYKGIYILFLLLIISVFVASSITKATDVSVTGKVNYEPVIKVYPERRIPATNNWGNLTVVEIRYPGTTTPIFTQVVQTDSAGVALMQPIDSSMVPPGNYDIAIKGYSHLREVFSDYPFYSHVLNIDLTASGKVLLAGDTVNDNYINSIDLSYMIRNLYSGTDIKSDLNRDGVVNSLDVSNIATNLYLKGDD
jgi:hypothetical protein